MTTRIRWAIILVILAIVLTWNYAAAATLSPKGCSTLALISLEVVWAKEVGADREKVIASLTKESLEDRSGVMSIVLFRFQQLWETSAGWMEVGQWTLQDCFDRKGIYPEAT